MTDTIKKLETGPPGSDDITQGGLPMGRTTLVAGTAGSGKTFFATQVQFSPSEADRLGELFSDEDEDGRFSRD